MEKGKSLEVRSCFVMGSGLTHVEGERDGKKEMWWEAGHKKMYLRIKCDGRMSGNKTQRPDESMLKRVCVPVCVHVCVPLRVHVRGCVLERLRERDPTAFGAVTSWLELMTKPRVRG